MPKVHVIGPRAIVEAGPSKVSDHPTRASKGKNREVEFLEMGKVQDAESVGLSDEHWCARQRFLADRVFKKRLEIKVLFKEIAAIEVMMEE